MRLLVLVVMVAGMLVGCGGGVGNAPARTPVKFSVFWDERSRTVNAPSSALSGILTMTGTGNSGLTFTFNRMEGAAGGLQTLTTSQPITAGDATFLIRFMSEANGAGSEVARAAGAARIAADGSGLGTVTTVQNVTRVSVTPGQSLNEGQNLELQASAYNGQGQTVAVSSDSIFWSVAGNPNSLAFVDGIAQGRKRGIAQVVATIDRIASPPADVVVSFAARVIPILPAGGGDGITFVNAINPDGTVAVGTTRNTTQIQGFRWTEVTGTVGLGTHAGFTGASAFGVNDDGSVIVGTATDDDGGG